ncbi:MAG: MATE family efflux transporter [Clostridiales Family XIII bacterium]|jgi:putative MATE family efflux protein|nr:MATE family efflux transporter [Clostridiales Family XIII bacterium]
MKDDNKDYTPGASNKMGTMPVGRLLRDMSMPPIISMIVFALYNIVDSIFVAKVSQDALAAVSLVFPVQMLMAAINVGMGVGLASLISRRLGQGRGREAKSAAVHGFALLACAWVAYAIFGIFLAGPFLRLFTDSPGIFGPALVYCRCVTIGSIFFCGSVTIERILQATGNALHPMLFNAAGALLNAGLAPVFIIGLFGAPALGVLGAGLVAVFGQCVSCVIAVILFRRATNEMRLSASDVRGFRFDRRIVLDVLAVGAPSIVMQSMTSFLIGALNAILISYSDTAVAVFGVYFRVQSFIFLPLMGLHQGALPIMGYSFGAQKRGRLVETFTLSLKIGFLIMALGTAAFWLLPEQIMRLFSADAAMMAMGVTAMRIISISFVPSNFVILSTALFQALAHGLYAMCISIVRQLVFLVPLAYLLSMVYGVDGVWYSFPLAEISALVLAAIFLRRIFKGEINRLPN